MLIILVLVNIMDYLHVCWQGEAGTQSRKALTSLRRMQQRYDFLHYEIYLIYFTYIKIIIFLFWQSKEVKENVAKYSKDIANVLAKIDPQMILIFKTKDLLRNIEFNLGTHNNKTSLVQMYKSCKQVIRAEEMRVCQTKWCYFKTSIKSLLDQLKITFYQIHLWLWWSYLGRLFQSY